MLKSRTIQDSFENPGHSRTFQDSGHHTIESPINKIDVKIRYSKKVYLKQSFRLTLGKEKQLPNGEIKIRKDKCKPGYVEAVILEISKYLMSGFHY